MVYLYAALGVVMMTGIMTVVEMGLSLTGQSLISKPFLSNEQRNSMDALRELDKEMLLLLSKKHEVQGLDPLGSPELTPLKGSTLCRQVLCRIKRQESCLGEDGASPQPESVKELLKFDESAHATSGKWTDSCALEMDNKYRLLIRPDSQIDRRFPYYLYSCVLNRESSESESIKCNFETSL